MRLAQYRWSPTDADGWQLVGGAAAAPQLVLLFGARSALQGNATHALHERHPQAHILGCSTAGEICGTEVSDEHAVATALEFESSHIRVATRSLHEAGGSLAAGEQVAHDLDPVGLVHVFALADGLHVNGSALVEGLRRALPPHVAVTGGLAGDGDRFKNTLIVHGTDLAEDAVSVVGFYGEALRVGYGSLGGWDQFGPERRVTRSQGNVLFELDGSSALALYKEYLGPHAAELPASGLLFPLSVRRDPVAASVVRTILAVDEAAGSLTFAGDVPEGSLARLMKANVDRLIDGAMGAATASYEAVGSRSPELAILISCVGRKLVLRQRVEEEVESVRDVLGSNTVLAGFYSYGEIAPFSPSARCELHNQTMTITTLSER